MSIRIIYFVRGCSTADDFEQRIRDAIDDGYVWRATTDAPNAKHRNLVVTLERPIGGAPRRLRPWTQDAAAKFKAEPVAQELYSVTAEALRAMLDDGYAHPLSRVDDKAPAFVKAADICSRYGCILPVIHAAPGLPPVVVEFSCDLKSLSNLSRACIIAAWEAFFGRAGECPARRRSSTADALLASWIDPYAASSPAAAPTDPPEPTPVPATETARRS